VPHGGGYADRLALRASLDSKAPSTAKRQMDATEDKVGGQSVRVQQQNDRLRETALSRIESKIAWLSGSCTGLTREAQEQVRRIDKLDIRVMEWRCAMEEKISSHIALQERMSYLENLIGDSADKHAKWEAAHGNISKLLKSHEARGAQHAALQERLEYL
jgi:hypothetical protein